MIIFDSPWTNVYSSFRAKEAPPHAQEPPRHVPTGDRQVMNPSRADFLKRLTKHQEVLDSLRLDLEAETKSTITLARGFAKYLTAFAERIEDLATEAGVRDLATAAERQHQRELRDRANVNRIMAALTDTPTPESAVRKAVALSLTEFSDAIKIARRQGRVKRQRQFGENFVYLAGAKTQLTQIEEQRMRAARDWFAEQPDGTATRQQYHAHFPWGQTSRETALQHAIDFGLIRKLPPAPNESGVGRPMARYKAVQL